ncbi:MAG: F0F1 ATP synthase subunit B, partial [Ferruginibacter sp.]
DAKDVADKMVTEAKEKARTEYDRIVGDAQSAINQQKMAAITDLKNQVGKLVLEVSEKILRRELTDKSEQELYITKLAEEAKLN